MNTTHSAVPFARLGLLALCSVLSVVGTSWTVTGAESSDSDLELLEWLSDLGDYPAIVEEGDRLIAIGACDERCHELRGMAAFRLERLEPARESLSRVLASQPENRLIAGYLGLCLIRLAEAEESAGRIGTARVLFEEAADALTLASEAQAPSVTLLRAWAIALAGAGRQDEEPLALRAILARDADAIDVRLRLAELLKGAERLDEARAALESAPQMTDAIETALFNVAVRYFQAGGYAATEELATRILERSPSNAQAYRLRGFARFRDRGLDAALSDLETFCQLEPDSPEAAEIRQQLAAR